MHHHAVTLIGLLVGLGIIIGCGLCSWIDKHHPRDDDVDNYGDDVPNKRTDRW